MVKKDYVPAFNYDFLTPFYDFFVELLGYGASQRNKVISLLKLKSGEKLLDVGCGTGTLLVLAKKRFPDVDMTGVDIDSKVLEISQKKVEKEKLDIKLVESGAQKLPFRNSSFDVVVSTLIFHHLHTEVKKATISEIYRVLKKDGRFLLADFGKKQGIILPLLDLVTEVFGLPEHKTLQDNLKGLNSIFMRDVGFRVTEVAPRDKGIEFLLATKSQN